LITFTIKKFSIDARSHRRHGTMTTAILRTHSRAHVHRYDSVLGNLGTQAATAADVNAAVQAIESNVTTQLTSLSAAVATNAMLIGQLQDTTDRVLTQVQHNANALAQIQREVSAPKQGLLGKLMSAIGVPANVVSTVGGVLQAASTVMEVGELVSRRRRGTVDNGTVTNNNSSIEFVSVFRLGELNMYVVLPMTVSCEWLGWGGN
jgi:hypothetical protein